MKDTATLACVAHAHTQACQYTDDRVRQLERHFNAIQASLHQERERIETKHRRVKLLDRCVFLVIGAVATKLIDAAVLPALAVFCLGLSPDLGKELFEFFRKI